MKLERENYYSRPELRDRGWTDAAVKKFAPLHDAERPNPMYKSAAPMKLWLKEAIEAIETSQSFQDFQSGKAKRAAAAQRAVKTKVDALLEQVRAMQIVVRLVPTSALLDLAIEHYNDRQDFFGDVELASRISNPEFLQRIRDNYIRHELTNYDSKLEAIVAKTGRADAYQLICARVQEAITKIYPDYLGKASLDD